MVLHLLCNEIASTGASSTFVPAGVTLHIVHQAKHDTLVGEFHPLQPVPNYRLRSAGDQRPVVPNDAEHVVVVTPDVDLCTAPANNPCVSQHRCDGIFGRLGRTYHRASLLRITCLPDAFWSPESIVPEPRSDEEMLKDRFTALWRSDSEAAARYFDRLSVETQTALLSDIEILEWAHVRTARAFVNDFGFLAFRRYAPQTGSMREVYGKVPELATALQKADDYVRRYLEADERTRIEILASLTAADCRHLHDLAECIRV